MASHLHKIVHSTHPEAEEDELCELAMAVADDDNNIVMWDLAAEVETKRLAASGKAPAVFLQWNANTSMALVSVSAHGVVSLVDTAAGTALAPLQQWHGPEAVSRIPPVARIRRYISAIGPLEVLWGRV